MTAFTCAYNNDNNEIALLAMTQNADEMRGMKEVADAVLMVPENAEAKFKEMQMQSEMQAMRAEMAGLKQGQKIA